MSEEINTDPIKKCLNVLGINSYTKNVEKDIYFYIHNYVTALVEDACEYSSHAGRCKLEESDFDLAIELQRTQDIASPPSAEILSEFSNCTYSSLSVKEKFCNLLESSCTQKPKFKTFKQIKEQTNIKKPSNENPSFDVEFPDVCEEKDIATLLVSSSDTQSE